MIATGGVQEVIDRVNSETTLLKTPAQLAWTTDPIDDFDQEVPTCLVYPSQQFASQIGDTAVCRQQINPSVSCIIVCKLAELSGAISEVRGSLVGWQPGDHYEAFRFTHRNLPFGSPMDIRGEYIWWLETYETTILHRTV